MNFRKCLQIKRTHCQIAQEQKQIRFHNKLQVVFYCKTFRIWILYDPNAVFPQTFFVTDHQVVWWTV